MHIRLIAGAFALALAPLPLLSSGALAQLAVSANDGKAVLVDGVNSVPAEPALDYVTVIDLGASPPRVVGEVTAPVSVVGPPQSVAVSHDESFALVVASTKVDPADPKKTVPDNRLTVIDLKAKPIAVLQTLEAGAGAAGVSINRAGTLALVTNRAEGTVSIFTIAGKQLTAAGKISLGDAKSGPCLAAFSPDGKTALVTRDGDHKVSILKIDGNNVEYAKRDMTGGIRPYGIEISSKGDVAVFGNQGGGQGDADVISVIDMKAQPPRIVDTISVGQTPEGVAMSPKGDFVAVTVTNGSNKAKSSPFFHDNGLLRVFAMEGTRLSLVAQAPVGHWCQGAAWSRDQKTILVQCMVEKELQVFRFTGDSLRRTGEIKLKAGPAGIRTADH
jgi:DNA-binding beta-propeller fold protein YncE